MLVVSARILAYFREATSTIPIVAVTGDPILFGIVSNVSRPEGNITGFSADASSEIRGKYLEILKEMKPTLSRVGLLSAKLSWEPYGRPLWEIAKRMSADGLIVPTSAKNAPHARLIVELAEKNRLVAIYSTTRYTKLGGLAAYAVDLGDIGSRAAGYIHKLLQGAKPSELPYYMPTRVQLIINLKAAKALGLTIPPSLLARTDEVIE
jgi:putative tryptophan/tyrosine transport system substrate-binding protein